MSLKDRVVSLAKNTALLPLYDVFGGLSEFWVAIFGGFGIYLAVRGKLDANYSAMISALTALLVAHDSLDDYHTRKMRNPNDPDSKPQNSN
jgi:hypothetical protein